MNVNTCITALVLPVTARRIRGCSITKFTVEHQVIHKVDAENVYSLEEDASWYNELLQSVHI
jgi:hypothetical protein